MYRRNGMTLLLALSITAAGASLAGCADDHRHGDGYGYNNGAYWNGDDHDRSNRDWRDDRHDRRDNNDDNHHGWWWNH